MLALVVKYSGYIHRFLESDQIDPKPMSSTYYLCDFETSYLNTLCLSFFTLKITLI
jgi:hypothetical protein